MDVHTIEPILFQTVKAAGVVARNLQANIQNEGKTIEREERESDAHFAMREAKTKVDELVQEMLLQSVYPVSYTHLDVYKRQIQVGMVRLCSLSLVLVF